MGLRGGPEGSRRGVAHSKVQGRGDKSVPSKETLLFRGEKGETDGKYYKWG